MWLFKPPAAGWLERQDNCRRQIASIYLFLHTYLLLVPPSVPPGRAIGPGTST